jgi:Protein of unknown function (DUF3822)
MNPLAAEASLLSQTNIVDESFRPENGGDYFLSVLVNGNAVSWSVMDRKRNKVIALKSKSFDSEISSLKEDDLIKGVDYRSIHVAEVNKHSTLIPTGLYEKGDEEKYLSFNSPIGNDMDFFADRLKSENIVNVFACSKNTVETFKKLFPNVVFHHFSTPLIDGILYSSASSNEKKIYLHVQKTSCEVIVAHGKKLLLSNSFPVTDYNECAYYTMFVMEQLHLNHADTELILFGEITSGSELISILSAYIGKVSLGKRPAMFEYSYGFNELPGQLHYPLISQYLCAL